MLEQPVKFNLQQERDFGEKLNGSFTFVSQNFKPLLLLLIKGAVPLAIIAGIAQGVYTSGLFSAMDTIRNSNEITDVGVFSLNWLSTVFAPVYLLSILFIFMTMVMTQCIVYGYMKIYNEKSGSVISETEVFEIVKRKFIIVLLADFVVAFITILAMV